MLFWCILFLLNFVFKRFTARVEFTVLLVALNTLYDLIVLRITNFVLHTIIGSGVVFHFERDAQGLVRSHCSKIIKSERVDDQTRIVSVRDKTHACARNVQIISTQLTH